MARYRVLVAACGLLLLVLPVADCRVVNPGSGTDDDGDEGEEPPPLGAVVLVGTALAVAGIVLALGCVCCRDDGLKMLGVHNGIQVPHLPMSNVLAPTSDELTIFPPPASRLAFRSTPHEDEVRFEPLPKIFPRGGGAKRTAILRPAHFSGELGTRASSVHDWFDDPQANFPRQQLQYLQELGTGWFGQAVRGEAHDLGPAGTVPVVVKILRTDATPTEHLCFLHEVQPYRVLRHPNVLRLLGRCLESDPFLVILEESATDLKSFLLQRKSSADSFFASGAPLHAACAIVAGLQHMHRYNFVHTDLAARNCVITRDQSIKVGDYGTSIQAYKEDYYVVGEVAVPIRWSAPESIHCTEIALEAREITKEANVWSLGVLLWELATLCATPYSRLNDDEVLQRVIMQKRLILEKPKVASPHLDRLYQVMTWCWNDPLERPTVQEIAGLLIHLRDHSETDSGTADFESRWRSLRPVMVREHNLAPGHPAARQLSHLGFESDFAPASSASLRDLRGSIEDLNREEDELTSMQISEAIHDLDAILAAESSSSADSRSDRPPVGNDSLCSLESKENSLGFKKSASVEDLLKEGPEKVAQLFRITVIDDDEDPRSPSSLADDNARRIWSSAETLSATGREAAALKRSSEECNTNESTEEREVGSGDAASTRSLGDPPAQAVPDVSSRMTGCLPGGGKPVGGSSRTPSPANTASVVRNTNGHPASCVESVAAVPTDGSSSFGCEIVEGGGYAHLCAASNQEGGGSGDGTDPDGVRGLDFSRGSEESASPRGVAAASPEVCTAQDSSGNSALYVTAAELSDGSIVSTTDISLVEGFSDSADSYVTARPEDGDDTSECSEATLADEDRGCDAEGSLESSLISDATLDDWPRKNGLAAEYDDSLDLSDSSLAEKIDRMKDIVNRVVAQQNGIWGRNGDLESRDFDGGFAPEDSPDDSEGGERNTDSEFTEDDRCTERTHEDSTSDEYGRSDGDASLHKRSARMTTAAELCEEEEILTVNTVTNEITVTPARLVLDGEEVLAGVTSGDASDTDDTSSTGTSASTTSGSFECSTLDRGTAEEVDCSSTGMAWNRSATPTKGVLKSSEKGHPMSSSSNLRKSVSFNDVIRSVYHYPPTDDEPPTPPPTPPPRVRSTDLDYASVQDWDFQSSLEDEDFAEEMESSDDEASHRGRIPSRPLAASTLGPLYSISGLSQEDLHAEAEFSSPEYDRSAEDGRCSGLLSDERPPWDSMSDLSCLDGTSDDGMEDFDEPIRASTPTCDGKIEEDDMAKSGNLRDANANVRAFTKTVPHDEVNSNRASENSAKTLS